MFRRKRKPSFTKRYNSVKKEVKKLREVDLDDSNFLQSFTGGLVVRDDTTTEEIVEAVVHLIDNNVT